VDVLEFIAVGIIDYDYTHVIAYNSCSFYVLDLFAFLLSVLLLAGMVIHSEYILYDLLDCHYIDKTMVVTCFEDVHTYLLEIVDRR
jgi:hypothetical protein